MFLTEVLYYEIVQAREALGYGEKDIVILLMPASRAQELRHVWPIIASAARLLLTRILALEKYVIFELLPL
jgi:lipid A disaccharide synthetase